MKKKLVKLIGLAVFVIGAVFSLNSSFNLTGAFIGASSFHDASFFLGIAFLLIGAVIFSTTIESRTTEVYSSIKQNPALLRLTRETVKNQEVERELNHLLKQLSSGNFEAGLNPKHLERTTCDYLRGPKGARLFYRKTGKNEYNIVAKASKNNEPQVINSLRRYYPKVV